MNDKIEFRGRNKLGNFANVPVFVGKFYVISDFTVVEDMKPYLDEGMRDIVVGEPFCKALCVEARSFDGIITIRDGDDSVTYQMVRGNPRFKHLTNEQRSFESITRLYSRSKDGRMAHTQAHKKGLKRQKEAKTIKNQQETGKRQRDKSKSEKSAKDHSQISPTQKERKSRAKIKSKGP
ncbi:hypothetical protein Tco_0854065 [Tanacetum coccineum]